MGYHRAGFDVFGVDIDPQPNFPFPFYQGDALEVMRRLRGGESVAFTSGDVARALTLSEVDAFAASPQCQAFSRTKTLHGNEHPDLIEPTRIELRASGKPWVLENVVGAPLIDPIRLTGQHFGMTAPDVDGVPLKLVRTRLFESNVELRPPDSFTANRDIKTASVYGAGGGWTPRHRDNPDRRGGYIPATSVLQELLGIDWMTKHELSQSIPPKFTEYIGRQLIEHINNARQE